MRACHMSGTRFVAFRRHVEYVFVKHEITMKVELKKDVDIHHGNIV